MGRDVRLFFQDVLDHFVAATQRIDAPEQCGHAVGAVHLRDPLRRLPGIDAQGRDRNVSRKPRSLGRGKGNDSCFAPA